MPPGYFTPEEANSILPRIIDRLNLLSELRIKLQQQEKRLIQAEYMSLVEYAREKRKLNKLLSGVYALIEEIEEFGCIIKDVDTNLIDFPAKRFDAEVWLCWRLGEPKVMFWHPRGEGFASRRPLTDDISSMA